MRDELKAELLRSFTVREAELIAANGAQTEYSWRWSDGVILFPEARCPMCSQYMRSNRIWKAEEYILHGQWRLDPAHGNGNRTGRLVKEPPSHPHVNGGGICMGNATSAAQALFMAMRPSDSYWENNRWGPWLLEMFGHRCGSSAVDDDDDCDCLDCRIARGEAEQCPHCHDYIDTSEDADMHGYWCDWCEDNYCPAHVHNMQECANCAGRDAVDLNNSEMAVCTVCESNGDTVYYCSYAQSGPYEEYRNDITSSCLSRHVAAAHGPVDVE